MKKYELEAETEFCVYLKGRGHVQIRYTDDARVKCERKYVIGKQIKCPPGQVEIKVIAYNPVGLPCAFIEGERIASDESWLADDYTKEYLPAGCNDLFRSSGQNPMQFPYSSRTIQPQRTEVVQGGILYDFGEELTAETAIYFEKETEPFQLCYGESREEALDTEWCYLKHEFSLTDEEECFGRFESEGIYRTKLRAFRYIFIPEISAAAHIRLEADYKFVDFPKRSSFNCADPLLNQIWEVSERTFRLSNGIFFLDGIKRDRWIWSGDAYQSSFINRYLSADPAICRRTILALRGKDPVRQHINTIVDYSMYWIISIWNYYEMTADKAFVQMIYPKVESMMEYCREQTEEHGFIYGRGKDWIYIDWADLDKDGTLCAEQMLLAKCYETMSGLRKLLEMDDGGYEALLVHLKAQIRKYFWDEEKGAFIDSWQSGRRNVTRHANIFAILFGYVDKREKDMIGEHVLFNQDIPAITTPYFKFYELECMAKLDRMDIVMDTIRSYWGGMLAQGATTFWEEYKPEEPKELQYGMYGDKYGKSLCHGWGASPIYLIGRYCIGLHPTSPGYQTFEISPSPGLLETFSCEFPVGGGYLKIAYSNDLLQLETDREGGTLVLENRQYELVRNRKLSLTYRGEWRINKDQ